ncbi:hypothetical protein MFIFM68171_03039 [Madurella fahalii]|uniref:Uncharacterized protein n=1 Tax=Madurella fahalii TaxID=1157608 RepID=A0ABQ0G512_9PEZI
MADASASPHAGLTSDIPGIIESLTSTKKELRARNDRVDMLLAQAEKCRDNAEIDPGPVQLAFNLLVENNALKEKNEEATAKLNHLNFHLIIGDWAEDIRKKVAKYEDAACDAQEAAGGKEMDADRGPEGTASITKHSSGKNKEKKKWFAMKRKNADEIYSSIVAETETVKAWRARGGLEADAPRTPVLDRIFIMCQLSGVEYNTLVETIKIGVERNDKAHAGQRPHLEDYLKPDSTELDWDAIKENCTAPKKWALKGGPECPLTKEQADVLVRMIDTWYPLCMKAVAEGKLAEELSSTKCKKDDREWVKLLYTPYKKGKWDHIPD